LLEARVIPVLMIVMPVMMVMMARITTRPTFSPDKLRTIPPSPDAVPCDGLLSALLEAGAYLEQLSQSWGWLAWVTTADPAVGLRIPALADAIIAAAGEVQSHHRRRYSLASKAPHPFWLVIIPRNITDPMYGHHPDPFSDSLKLG
jgi:hypothetical protein